MSELSLHWTSIDDLPDALVNPKGHDLDLIAASIERFGITEPAVIDERTGRLLAGHGRRDALRLLRDRGVESLPQGVHVRDDGAWVVQIVRGVRTDNDEEAQAYVVLSNRSSEKGGWLNDLLVEVLRSTPEDLMFLTGFSLEQRADMLALAEPPLGLDKLAANVGEPHDRDMWPILRLQVAPSTRDRYEAVVGSLSADDNERMVWLLDHAALSDMREGS